jgi:hypothetical protein
MSESYLMAFTPAAVLPDMLWMLDRKTRKDLEKRLEQDLAEMLYLARRTELAQAMLTLIYLSIYYQASEGMRALQSPVLTDVPELAELAEWLREHYLADARTLPVSVVQEVFAWFQKKGDIR